jgi:eukaryotic-like serine/threonine-protein kinase
MATVYLGRLKGAVGFTRSVAIKRLHPQFAKQPEFTTMFIDEARIAARLVHPNVVATLDVVAEDGELSLVMEYVEGETLDRLVKMAGRAPLPIVSGVLVGLCEGLHAAHEAKSERGEPLGVVHRDVSPQNVLVGVDGVARVLDFGIAKAVDRLQITQDGGLKGKVAYMAPEQLRLEPVDRRTDVYAAGVVLWEALTGRRLFRATNPVAALQAMLSSTPTPPSLDNPEVTPELDAIVARAIAREPSLRFATARELAQALERAVPVANPRDVGAWVRSLAGDSIAQRSGLVALMHGGTQVTAAPAAAAQPTAPPDPGTAVAVTHASTTKPERHRAGYLIAAIAGAAVAGLIVLALRSSSAPEVQPVPTLASTPAIATPPTSSATIAMLPSAAVAPSTSADTPKPMPGAARPKKNCNPPYIVDKDGVKTYKPGCLR